MRTINGKNYFNEKSFNEMVEALNNGEEISVYIDCIGHTRNNMEQDNYKRHLEETFGSRLHSTLHSGACSYHYDYKLKEN